MEKRPSLILPACLAVCVIAIAFIALSRGSQPKVPPQVTAGASYAPPAAKANNSDEATVGSSDGKWTLKMKGEKSKTDTLYVFWVLNSADGSQKEIFRKTIPLGSTFEIPANTFSPDGKYVFLKELDSGTPSYLVLSASGASLTKNTQTLEIVSLFAAKFPNYKITDMTGWGGMNLIVFNTDKVGGGIGPSFWFEVPSGGFIQLSNRFN